MPDRPAPAVSLYLGMLLPLQLEPEWCHSPECLHGLEHLSVGCAQWRVLTQDKVPLTCYEGTVQP